MCLRETELIDMKTQLKKRAVTYIEPKKHTKESEKNKPGIRNWMPKKTSYKNNFFKLNEGTHIVKTNLTTPLNIIYRINSSFKKVTPFQLTSQKRGLSI